MRKNIQLLCTNIHYYILYTLLFTNTQWLMMFSNAMFLEKINLTCTEENNLVLVIVKYIILPNSNIKKQYGRIISSYSLVS